LFTGIISNSIWLTVVLVQTSVDLGDNIWSDWGLENGWHVDGFTSGSTIGAIYGYNWTSSHNYSGPIQVC